jgi:hypothetical protein
LNGGKKGSQMKNKLSYLVLLPICFFAALFIIPRIIFKPIKHVALSEIQRYVQENNEYLTDIAQKLLQSQGDNEQIVEYDAKSDVPKDVNVDKLYKDLAIHYIFVKKNFFDNEDNVEILLKDKNGNYSCGIYYSPSGKLLDHGVPKEGDKYEYDGTLTGYRRKYRSEKICDNWYYFEDDTWN